MLILKKSFNGDILSTLNNIHVIMENSKFQKFLALIHLQFYFIFTMASFYMLNHISNLFHPNKHMHVPFTWFLILWNKYLTSSSRTAKLISTLKLFPTSHFLQIHIDHLNSLRINVTETLLSIIKINSRSYITVVDVMDLATIGKVIGIRDGQPRSGPNRYRPRLTDLGPIGSVQIQVKTEDRPIGPMNFGIHIKDGIRVGNELSHEPVLAYEMARRHLVTYISYF